MKMRALVVICLAGACGDNGLMLEIHPGTTDVASVEVFLPKDVQGDRMGMPMAMQKTAGTVYELADHVSSPVSGDTQILLQPGELDSVAELLVLGYNANHEAIRYADVFDPSGPIQLPHTHADTIKVDLDPIAEVPAAGATNGTGPRLVRWSQGRIDDPNGDCIALLTDGGGTFFSPGTDLDCDGADPECDDTWYLKMGTSTTPPDNPLCARDDQTTDTMDACRLGDTTACTDNVGDCRVRTELAICLPAPMCDKCNDQIDPSCFMNAMQDDATLHVQCDLPVGPNPSTQMLELCGGSTPVQIPLDLGPKFGGSFGIVTVEFDQPPALSGGSTDLALAGSTTASLHVTWPTGGTARGMMFTSENGATPAIDSGLPDTKALLVIAIHGGISRVLVLPFVAHYVPDCNTQPTCRLVQGVDNGQPFDDPIWHCSGI